MGLLAQFAGWLANRSGVSETPQPVMVVQYGSTKSYTFQREVMRGKFTLPSIPDQGLLTEVLRALGSFYLPDFTDRDFNDLRQMLIVMDDVILAGLRDPHNWVLPKGFSEHPFVRKRLDKNYPVVAILDSMLGAARLYVWLYRDDEGVEQLIPHLLELEESFVSLQTFEQDAEDNRDQIIVEKPLR